MYVLYFNSVISLKSSHLPRINYTIILVHKELLSAFSRWLFSETWQNKMLQLITVLQAPPPPTSMCVCVCVCVTYMKFVINASQ